MNPPLLLLVASVVAIGVACGIFSSSPRLPATTPAGRSAAISRCPGPRPRGRRGRRFRDRHPRRRRRGRPRSPWLRPRDKSRSGGVAVNTIAAACSSTGPVPCRRPDNRWRVSGFRPSAAARGCGPLTRAATTSPTGTFAFTPGLVWLLWSNRRTVPAGRATSATPHPCPATRSSSGTSLRRDRDGGHRPRTPSPGSRRGSGGGAAGAGSGRAPRRSRCRGRCPCRYV